MQKIEWEGHSLEFSKDEHGKPVLVVTQEDPTKHGSVVINNEDFWVSVTKTGIDHDTRIAYGWRDGDIMADPIGLISEEEFPSVYKKETEEDEDE